MAIISSLATSKYPTDKNWGARSASNIKYIIPHHMAARMTGAQCAQYFQNNGLENSVNYCIGYNGDISLSVYEDYGAWTSSFGTADKKAITVEISDTASPKNWTTLEGADWTIPGPAQEAFINLCVDLFKRYPSLGDKMIYDPSDAAAVANAKKNKASSMPVTKGNVLLHEWTSNYSTSCPEWHMKKILPTICAEVNKRLGSNSQPIAPNVKTKKELAIEVIQGKWSAGNDRINKLNSYIKENNLSFTAADVQKNVDLLLAKPDYTIKANDMLKSLATDNTLPVLKQGCKYPSLVTLLQTWLKNAGYMNVDADGSFGPITLQAVKDFQTNLKSVYGNNFSVTGEINSVYWKKLLGL